MENKKHGLAKKILGTTLFVLGCALCYLSFELNTFENRIIDLSAYAVSNGVPIESFKNYTNGLLAGGKITALPRFVVLGLAFASVLISYLGVAIFLGHPVLKTLRISYWGSFQKRFVYMEDNKPAVRKKLTKKKKVD